MRRPSSIPTCLRLLLSLALFALDAAAAVRLKDLVLVAGARDNQLVGYGLVTGIAEEGDKNPVYTVQTVANMLQWFGVAVPQTALSSKNVAAVMITAEIPPFAKPGTRIDVTISSLGDARTLQGGVLIRSPLLGVNNEIYAFAQGPISVGGFAGGQGGATVQKNHPTTAQIINGALVEKEIPATIVQDRCVELLLRDPDFTSASRLAAAVNLKFASSAQAIDATTIRVRLPEDYLETPVDFIARLEAVEVVPDTPARIVINERTGTIVANSRVHISSCAISHGNLTINIASSAEASQPNALSQTGQTTVVTNTQTTVNEAKSAFIALPELPTVEKVATKLNSLGVTPRDMMAIFQAMKQAGALQAELVIR